MLILSRRDVCAVLDDAPGLVLSAVHEAYRAHARGRTSLPHSVFLRFPDSPRDRIIALPAYVGGDRPVAAVKWVSSFPGNVERGADRASAAIVLNSMTDGRPVAFLEGAVISARRTAASAAIAAAVLTEGAPAGVRTGVSFVGCGVISFEVLRFLREELPELGAVCLYDLDPMRAKAFADRIGERWPDLDVEVAPDISAAMARHRVVSFATTAATPHVGTDACRPGTVVLHLSLRDLTAESILTAVNVVDDTDHVCRADTSLDLAQRVTGDRSFVAAELGDLLTGAASAPYRADAITVFSPFGLGVLDAVLAAAAVDAAAAAGLGTEIEGFADAVAGRTF